MKFPGVGFIRGAHKQRNGNGVFWQVQHTTFFFYWMAKKLKTKIRNESDKCYAFYIKLVVARLLSVAFLISVRVVTQFTSKLL
jgi:hypothetical protein